MIFLKVCIIQLLSDVSKKSTNNWKFATTLVKFDILVRYKFAEKKVTDVTRRVLDFYKANSVGPLYLKF